MCLLAVRFPICMRKIVVTMQKIATIPFFDTGCLMLIFYRFLFGQKSNYLVGGQNFSTGGTAPHASCLRGWLEIGNEQANVYIIC